MWKRVVIQDGVETSYDGAETKQAAEEWLAWKKRAHLEAGWSLNADLLNSVTVVRIGHEGKADKTRTFAISSV